MDNFIGREDELKLMYLFCKNKETALLNIVGESGSGKTALVNEFAKTAPESCWVFMYCPEPDESPNNFIYSWLDDFKKGRYYYKGLEAWNEILERNEKIAEIVDFALTFKNSSLKFQLSQFLERIAGVIDIAMQITLIIDLEGGVLRPDAEVVFNYLASKLPHNVKMIITRSSFNPTEAENGDEKDIKMDVIDLPGLSMDDSMKLAAVSGLRYRDSQSILEKLIKKSGGNPLRLETGLRLLSQKIGDKAAEEHDIDALPENLNDMMRDLYRGVKNNEVVDMLNWVSAVSRGIGHDMVSFLTNVSIDKVFELQSNPDLKLAADVLVERIKNGQYLRRQNIRGEFIPNCDWGAIIKPFHRMLSDVAIENMKLKAGDLSFRQKIISAYYLKNSMDNINDFESLRLYHLFLARSMDKEAYVKASIGLIDKFYDLNLNDSCVEIIERVIKYCIEIGMDKEDYVGFISKAGIICHEQRHIDKSISLFNKAISIHRELKDMEGVASDLSNLGIVHRDIFHAGKAFKCFNEALEIYVTINDKFGQSHVLELMWKMEYEMYSFNNAINYLMKLMVVTREIGLMEKLPSILGNIGNLYYGLKDFDNAVVYYEQALDISAGFGDADKAALYNSRIGMSYLENSLNMEAMEYFSNSLNIYLRLGNEYGMASEYANLGAAHKKIDNLDSAIDYYKRALKLFTKRNSMKQAKLMVKNIDATVKLKDAKEGKK